MYSGTSNDTTNLLADRASSTAKDAIKSTQGAVNDALDSLSGSVQELRDEAKPAIARISDQATALAQRGADAVRDGSQLVRDSARQASDRTVSYIRDEPVRSVLIAAATGAALMALVSLMARSNNQR